MSGILQAVKIDGDINVCFNKKDGLWNCTALQFDIIGVGDTKETAFEEMRNLLKDFLEEVIESMSKGEKINFFNPSPSEKWNRASTGIYKISILVEANENLSTLAIQGNYYKQFSVLSNNINRIRSVDLEPVCMCAS